MRGSVFISDLHLAPDTPDIALRLRSCLAQRCAGADALYILGDLFEFWVGDDQLEDPFPAGIAADLRRLADAGTRICIMHGNRDFLLGPDFMTAAGAELLPDPSIVDLYGTRTLLVHGDSLCTDDHAYLAYRQQVRDPDWQRQFFTKPLAERLAIAHEYRARSKAAQSGATMTISDVNPEAVAQALRESGCPRLIHGHTHRPDRHTVQLEGTTAERWVLPDWSGSGGGLLVGPEGCQSFDL